MKPFYTPLELIPIAETFVSFHCNADIILHTLHTTFQNQNVYTVFFEKDSETYYTEVIINEKGVIQTPLETVYNGMKPVTIFS